MPDDQARLPEGTPVNIVVTLADIAPELQPEFAAWDQAGDDAWAMIGEWEREEQP